MPRQNIVRIESAELRQGILTPIAVIRECLDEIVSNHVNSADFIEEINSIRKSCDILATKSNSLLNDIKILESEKNPDLSKFRHDLRNPLNGILGYAEIIEEEFEEDLDKASIVSLKKIKDLSHEIASAIDSIVNTLERNLSNEEISNAEDSTEEEAIERLFSTLNSEEYEPKISTDISGNSILIVDDNDSNRDLLYRRLKSLGFQCLQASGGIEALEVLQKEKIDLVLLDVLMPDMNGIEVLNEIRNSDLQSDLPVIMVSGFDDVRSVAKCIAIGASDYLSKPVDSIVLGAKVVAALERKALRSKSNKLMEQLTIQATTDQLTGIKNRRSIYEELDSLIENYKLSSKHFGIILLDIDFFKSVNDTYGHHAGDMVLIDAAKCFSENIRSNDFIGRQGGEEFLALIEGVDLEEIGMIGERVRSSIEESTIKVEGIQIKITVSGGIAHSSEQTDRDELINLADQRLYVAKQTGRNRIIDKEPQTRD
tara:strand:+ start:1667 stop:3118 length:1452 start_codon:yes stop_codon:yes gene_type:complete